MRQDRAQRLRCGCGEISHPAKEGLLQALGVFIDTLLICSCTAMIMLLTPASLTAGLEGMDLLQTSMQYHLGTFGVIFIAVILWLFSFPLFGHPLLCPQQRRLSVWR
ncbi:MAG: alanine:cation symporter family protein [Merdibacter sp.]